MSDSSVNAVILAGSRPGVDPFAASFNAPTKALIPVCDKPMLSHVTETLSGDHNIGRAVILAQTIAPLQNALRDKHTEKVGFVESSATIATSMEALLDDEPSLYPLMITTADNVLLDGAMIDHFCGVAAGCDIAIAVVEKKVLLARYPQSQRTWLKFNGGQYSGANLFYFGSAKARLILGYWAEVEQDRKKGWKILSIFGPWLLFLVMTRLISIDQLAERVGRKLGLKVAVVKMPQAEACIDIDQKKDLVLAEKILNARA